MPRVVRELLAFVGFGDDGAAAVRASAPAVLSHETAITSALYEHFLRFPDSVRVAASCRRWATALP